MIARHLHKFRPLAGDARGTAMAEFALIVPLLLLMMIGIIETALILLVGTLLEGSVREAGRYGITGYAFEGSDRIAVIRDIVGNHTIGLINMEEVNITTLTYPSFGVIGTPEPFDDANGSGTRDAGESFNDVNGNGQWDEDMGVAGAGGPGDIVVYTISYDWPIMTAMLGKLLGEAGTIKLRASYTVRNEPWNIGIAEGQ